MFFNSVDFAVFFPIVFTIYWLLPNNKLHRNTLILGASYFFYAYWDWRFLILIAISSIVDFVVGLALDKTEEKFKRKRLLGLSLFVNLGLLFYFKYTNFFIDSFVESFKFFGTEIEIGTLNIILPVGISFYTFQTLSYTIDIYRNQLKPSRDILSFFAFVAFFPQLVAGPIERASKLLPQFYESKRFNYNYIKSGLFLIAFGLFKKLVIADRAAVLVNQVYNNPSEHKGVEIILATVLFAFQIYCDFSGYSDIAIGTAKTMGFDLMKNFDSPYFSKSITEFWRRWHISLSTWFRDYVYIPLGGSRKGNYRTYANLFIVFLVSGLWHGAAINFVIWGGVHGLVIVVEKLICKKKRSIINVRGLTKSNGLYRLVFVIVTFSIVCFAWIFFRASTFANAITLIKNVFVNNYHTFFNSRIYELGLEKGNMIILGFAIIGLLTFELVHKKYHLGRALAKLHILLRWVSYIGIILLIIVLGYYGNENRSEFIYFQF